VVGLLSKLACTSLVAVKSLFELGVSSTIKWILITSDLLDLPWHARGIADMMFVARCY
jgi:hypothetical protein